MIRHSSIVRDLEFRGPAQRAGLLLLGLIWHLLFMASPFHAAGLEHRESSVTAAAATVHVDGDLTPARLVSVEPGTDCGLDSVLPSGASSGRLGAHSPASSRAELLEVAVPRAAFDHTIGPRGPPDAQVFFQVFRI